MRTLMFLVCLSLFLCGTAWANESETRAHLTEEAGEYPLKGFRALRDTSITSVEGGRTGPAISISRGLELVMIETKRDDALGTLVRLGFDQDLGLPTEVWVREQDLQTADFIPYDFSRLSDDEIDLWKRMTYCYRFVKRYLLQTGQVKTYLPGASAYQAASILPKHGFRRTGHNPASARNGEVCVYGGGPQGHGHIEVKRNGKWWYGYGYINHPIRNRKFIACFAK
jgi:hypothetical protein